MRITLRRHGRMLGPAPDGPASRTILAMEDAAPERVRWAIDVLDVQPDDRLLEIGCGGGAAVDLVCRRLGEGTITAIDRSPTMVARAAHRNAEHIASGRASVQLVELEDLELTPGTCTKVFSINVNLFWTRSAATELDIVRRLLRPDGALYLFFESPSASKSADIAERLMTALPESAMAYAKVPPAGLLRGRPT